MLSLLSISQQSKNFTSNVTTLMPLPVPFDHYLGNSENQPNRTEVLFHYCIEISQFFNILCSDALLFCGVQVYPSSIKRSCQVNEATCLIEDAADVLHRHISGNSATAVPAQLFWYPSVQHFHLDTA